MYSDLILFVTIFHYRSTREKHKGDITAQSVERQFLAPDFKPNYYGNRVVIRKRKPIAEFLSLTRPLRIHTYLNYGVISELSEPLYAFAY